MIDIKQMDKSEIHRLVEIDRTEKIKVLYEYKEGSLVSKKVDIDVPKWDHPEWRHDKKLISDLTEELQKGGILFGAFSNDKLVGMAVLGHGLRGDDLDQIQLVFLHVSNGFRRKGIGTSLLEKCRRAAIAKGAKRFYISSTPSESSVGFYQKHGGRLAKKIDEELYALEPEDIHLTMDL